jgi:hypothetical protein
MSTLYCREERGVQKYFLYAQMSFQCVECAFTVIDMLLVAINNGVFYFTQTPLVRTRLKLATNKVICLKTIKRVKCKNYL